MCYERKTGLSYLKMDSLRLTEPEVIMLQQGTNTSMPYIWASQTQLTDHCWKESAELLISYVLYCYYSSTFRDLLVINTNNIASPNTVVIVNLI